MAIVFSWGDSGARQSYVRQPALHSEMLSKKHDKRDFKRQSSTGHNHRVLSQVLWRLRYKDNNFKASLRNLVRFFIKKGEEVSIIAWKEGN